MISLLAAPYRTTLIKINDAIEEPSLIPQITIQSKLALKL